MRKTCIVKKLVLQFRANFELDRHEIPFDPPLLILDFAFVDKLLVHFF